MSDPAREIPPDDDEPTPDPTPDPEPEPEPEAAIGAHWLTYTPVLSGALEGEDAMQADTPSA